MANLIVFFALWNIFSMSGVFEAVSGAFLGCVLCMSGLISTAAGAPPAGLEGVWDASHYISIDEVEPGMEAYCETVYNGVEVERFDLDVLSVVRNYTPGRDAILVQGTDERFIHSGPVAGCSGSPVYIDGRLAGALAFGWLFSKDPLYGVTPIEEMLRVGKSSNEGGIASGRSRQTVGRYSFDYSMPIDLSEVERQVMSLRTGGREGSNGASALPFPLVTSGVPSPVLEELEDIFGPMGAVVFSGGGGGGGETASGVELTGGGCLIVPLVSGDISLEVIGTVTAVEGDDVYGFGHSFLGYGAVDLPMATGQVHAIVSSVMRSFKFATSLEVVGALRLDESAAVVGRLGAEARMIPLTVRVGRYNQPTERVYNCKMVDNRLLTPLLARTAVASAILADGDFPPNHSLEYRVEVGITGGEDLAFEDMSTGMGFGELIRDSTASLALMMNNPYSEVEIDSVEFDVRVTEENASSSIWSVDLSDTQVKAGERIEVEVVVESYLAERSRYKCGLRVPADAPPGRYELTVCGGEDYRDIVRRTSGHRFIAEDFGSLVSSMNELLNIGRDRLYCILMLQPRGISVERAELPDLPATKVLVLGDSKRALRIAPYRRWVEKSFDTGRQIVDRKVVQVTVEQ